jgi:hypothetical protein
MFRIILNSDHSQNIHQNFIIFINLLKKINSMLSVNNLSYNYMETNLILKA